MYSRCWNLLYFPLLVSINAVVWQTGELERWARRFRRPLAQAPAAPGVGPVAAPLNVAADPTQEPRPVVQRERQEGPVAAVTAILRTVEQVLFVFVASLWPNALGGGEFAQAQVVREDNARQGQQNRRNNENNNGDADGEERPRERLEQERVDVVI